MGSKKNKNEKLTQFLLSCRSAFTKGESVETNGPYHHHIRLRLEYFKLKQDDFVMKALSKMFFFNQVYFFPMERIFINIFAYFLLIKNLLRKKYFQGRVIFRVETWNSELGTPYERKSVGRFFLILASFFLIQPLLLFRT